MTNNFAKEPSRSKRYKYFGGERIYGNQIEQRDCNVHII